MTTENRTRSNESMGTFSERFPILYESDSRLKKADKIIAVCRHFSRRPLEELVCLDLGASTGIMTERFAAHFKEVMALDMDLAGLRSGRRMSAMNNINYICADGTKAALADGSVDVIICNQIYEHVDDQPGLVSEIFRTLRPDGFCYFGAGNRLVVVEGHYFLPFLSWLPPRLADIYMKLAGRKETYDVRLLTLRKLKRLLRDFHRHDYTRLIFKNPEIFEADDVVHRGNLVSRLPGWLYGLIYPFFPAWVWVLTRKE